MAVNAPIQLAKILQVPVIHSSHFATFTGLNFPIGERNNPVQLWEQHKLLMKLDVICRRLYNEEAGIISSDVKYNKLPKKS